MKAFPWHEGFEKEAGMDLRDYFAAKAMQAIANDLLGQDNDKLWQEEVNQLAQISYSVADAMMEARNG